MPHVYTPSLSAFQFRMQTTQPKKHRLRTKPTPGDHHARITLNDINGIFEPLSRHAQLTTKQLVAFDSRCESKTRNRLTQLFHSRGDWLVRLSETMTFANHLFMDEIYSLGVDAEALCMMRGFIPPEPWARIARIGHVSKMPSRILRLAHDHMVSDVVLDIEIGARQTGAKFRSHFDIIEAAPERTQKFPNPLRLRVPETEGAPQWIEPDATFAIDNRLFMVEADRGTESIEKIIRGKILAYREIVASRAVDKHFGFDNLRVLFVTTNEKRMRNIMKCLASIAKNGRSTMFAFACRPDLEGLARAPAPDGRMFRMGWERVGFEILNL